MPGDGFVGVQRATQLHGLDTERVVAAASDDGGESDDSECPQSNMHAHSKTMMAQRGAAALLTRWRACHAARHNRCMRTRILGLLVPLLLVASGLAAQEKPAGKPADVAGTWDLSVTSPNGTGNRLLKLQQDGEKLAGEIESSVGTGKVAGSVKGTTIAFTATVTMEAGTFEIQYTGKVDGDKMSGDVDFGEYGRGTWSGTRRK